MCLFKEAELNCVNTSILFRLELMQLEIGISTRRYLPAIGTAGLLRLAVSGYSLDPAPPPNTIEMTDLLSINGGLIGYKMLRQSFTKYITIPEITAVNCYIN